MTRARRRAAPRVLIVAVIVFWAALAGLDTARADDPWLDAMAAVFPEADGTEIVAAPAGALLVRALSKALQARADTACVTSRKLDRAAFDRLSRELLVASHDALIAAERDIQTRLAIGAALKEKAGDITLADLAALAQAPALAAWQRAYRLSTGLDLFGLASDRLEGGFLLRGYGEFDIRRDPKTAPAFGRAVNAAKAAMETARRDLPRDARGRLSDAEMLWVRAQPGEALAPRFSVLSGGQAAFLARYDTLLADHCLRPRS